MRIYKTLPELKRERQMSVWHKALRSSWSPEDIDWKAPLGIRDVIVLDLESGEERGSVYTGSHFPNGMFLTPGFGHDLYCSSNGFVSRLFVA